MRVANTLYKILFLVDQRCHQFRGIDLTVVHFKEMGVGPDNLIHNSVCIVDLPYRCNGKGPVMGAHQNGLRFKIRNTADAHGAVHLLGLLGKLRTKRRIFNIMYGFVKTGFRVIHRHSRPACAQVGVVVHPEKQIKYAIFFGYCGKIPAHYSTSSPWNVPIITDDSQNTKKNCNIFYKIKANGYTDGLVAKNCSRFSNRQPSPTAFVYFVFADLTADHLE